MCVIVCVSLEEVISRNLPKQAHCDGIHDFRGTCALPTCGLRAGTQGVDGNEQRGFGHDIWYNVTFLRPVRTKEILRFMQVW